MLASEGRPRRPQTVALGVMLASRGGLVVAALGVTAIATLVSVGVVAARRDEVGAHHLPVLCSMAIAWSAGIMLAFGAALRAIPNDWEEGIIALARVRGVRPLAYVRGRVAGLVAVLAGVLGGAAVLVGLVATAVSPAKLEAARDAASAVAYALAFAATLGPVTMAALGTRARVRGYFTLILVLVLPEAVAPWTAHLLPRGWHELTSIPAALAAVEVGVSSPTTAALPMARAVVGLAAVIVVALALVRTRIPRAARGDVA